MEMRFDELENLLREWNITVVPKEAMRVRGYDVDTYRKLAKETERVDYGCDFNNGICIGKAMGGNGCCGGCADAFGYWRKEDGMIDEDTAKKVAEFYESGSGFCRDGTGCFLPRELRSPTCLYIFCSDANMSGHDRELLYRIQYGAHWS